MANQTPIQMYDQNGGWNQQFELCSSDNAFPGYIIRNPASPTIAGEEVVSISSGKCVDIANSNFNAGVELQQYTCNGGLNQLFFMNAV